jgi:aminoglycoside phosphotransferase (APT) family kinase protein
VSAEAFPAGLADWLAPLLAAESGGSRQTGEALVDLTFTDIRRPAAGQSNDTVLFTANWRCAGRSESRQLVLRRQPSGQQIFLQPDVVREGRILQGLELGGRVPVPHVVGCESDPGVVGCPFFVMDQIHGRVPLARPSIHLVGWLPALTAAERRQLWDSAMDVLVGVHATDWRVTHGFLLEGIDADQALDRHLAQLVDWYRWTTAGRSFPITDSGIERLVADRAGVRTDDPVLVWGDARVGNMIFDDDNQAAAAIDWEVATIGPAAIDVAHWLFFDAFATSASGVARLDGWPDRDTTIDEYEQRSGRVVNDLWYFELMDEVFMATTLIRQADFRVARGAAAPGTRMGAANTVTQMLARRLGLPVPELSPDYIAHRSGTS